MSINDAIFRNCTKSRQREESEDGQLKRVCKQHTLHIGKEIVAAESDTESPF